MINIMLNLWYLKSHNQDVFPVRTESKRVLERMELSRNKRKKSSDFIFIFSKNTWKLFWGIEQVGSGVWGAGEEERTEI